MDSDMVYRKSNGGRSTLARKPNETMRVFMTICVGILFGFFIGVSFPTFPFTKLNITSALLHDFAVIGNKSTAISTDDIRNISTKTQVVKDVTKIWVPSNPKGAERLPPGIVASESDFYQRRLWGMPSEDLANKPKYLVTFTVGYNQRNNIDKAVKKASGMLKGFYIQTLSPHTTTYLFWDEDLGVEHFDAEEYIKLVRKHGLEISQPGLQPTRSTTWQMTKKRDNREVHKETEEKPGWCSNPHLPPCAAFVEIMAPVFSRDAWRCVWHLIQNDLVHGWGLDFALQRCVEPPHEKIGVVDAQWIVHQTVPSLGNQGQAEGGKAPWRGVRLRCEREWKMFKTRLENAEKSYYKSIGIDPSNFMGHSIGIDPSNFTGHS
ncbi:UNVERIFIED_CONTAM: hypothetical protein Scaly_1471900 [Sesamum calycinum]|uniref:Uncharacterized protein n=1 Tax=Sesamum calycinum TaxID=2727403 RepID=A0AAW2PPS0_9LAMI